MAEFNSKGEPLFTVVRILEYHGTEKWLRAVMEASRVPFQGEFQAKDDKGQPIQLPEGTYIKSGQVQWLPEEEDVNRGVIPIPPASGSGRVM